MKNYIYKAKDLNGKIEKGLFKGDNKEEIIKYLHNEALYPINIREDTRKIRVSFNDIFPCKIPIKEIALFCRQFSVLINSGITIIKSLDVLIQQTENKKLKKVLKNLTISVQKGISLSASMKEYKYFFPELLIDMIEVGELSGKLDIILKRMADHYEKEYKINNKIKNAMTYPLIVIFVAIIVVFFLVYIVLPLFVEMFNDMGIELPLTTQVLLFISGMFIKYWHVNILVFLLIFSVFYRMININKFRESIDGFKIKIPILGSTIKKVIISRFTRTLSILLASGISILDSIDIVQRVIGNYKVAKKLSESKTYIKKGLSLSKALNDILIFSPMMISMIKIGEETGTLDKVLEKTAEFYDEEVKIELEKFTTLLEPILIFGLSLVIGFIVISLVIPMFNMMNNIGY